MPGAPKFGPLDTHSFGRLLSLNAGALPIFRCDDYNRDPCTTSPHRAFPFLPYPCTRMVTVRFLLKLPPPTWEVSRVIQVRQYHRVTNSCLGIRATCLPTFRGPGFVTPRAADIPSTAPWGEVSGYEFTILLSTSLGIGQFSELLSTSPVLSFARCCCSVDKVTYPSHERKQLCVYIIIDIRYNAYTEAQRWSSGHQDTRGSDKHQSHRNPTS